MTLTRHSWLFSKKLYTLILNETRENFKQNFFGKELHENFTISTPVVAHQLSYGTLRTAQVFPRKSIPALFIFLAGVSDSSGFSENVEKTRQK